MNYTAEQLAEAIRASHDLSELKRMVGPNDQQQQRNRERLAELDAIFEQYGADHHRYPVFVKARWSSLSREQREFESNYC